MNVGLSLTGSTVMSTVAGTDGAPSDVAVNEKLSGPL